LRDAFLADAPELMTLSPEEGEAPLFGEGHAGIYLEAARTRSAVVLGCGLGQAPQTQAFVRELIEGVESPLLIDADGLNALDGEALRRRGGPTIITPHPGELARLSGLSTGDLAADRVGHARRLAADWEVILLLKGAATVVAAPTGEVFINTTGDQGLATAGSGDVLSGIIGGLLAQGLAPLAATLLGVFLHGLARDCQSEELAAPYFSASDLLKGLNRAFLELAS
jgi:NAD(P)H-hydrate epimerase